MRRPLRHAALLLVPAAGLVPACAPPSSGGSGVLTAESRRRARDRAVRLARECRER